MNLGVMFVEVAMVKKLLGADSGSLMKCPVLPCWGIPQFSDNFQLSTRYKYPIHQIHYTPDVAAVPRTNSTGLADDSQD